MRKQGQRSGQSLLEYSILLIILLAVFLSMQSYVKRGIQGRWKASVDNLGDQYDPRTANSKKEYTLNSASRSVLYTVQQTGGFETRREDTSSSSETKDGQTTVGAIDN